MASDALVLLSNNTTTNRAFDVSISKPVKFVSRIIVPALDSVEVEVETVIPMVFFDRDFQDAIANGNISITFAFTTAAGSPSMASNYLANIQRFLSSIPTGWQSP